MQTGYDSLPRTSGVDSKCQNCSKGGKKCHLYSEVASLERPNPSHSTSDRTDLPKPIKQTKLNTLKPLNQPGNLNTIKRDI